jgi:hypothetical protein
MRAFAIFLLITSVTRVQAQPEKEIKLVGWKALDCDHTYDAHRLVNRITAWETQKDKNVITINFSDNCCAQFKPVVKLVENKLFLRPYESYFGSECECNCCFSIQFEIAGLVEKKYEVYFKDKRVEQSENHYKVWLSRRHLDVLSCRQQH